MRTSTKLKLKYTTPPFGDDFRFLNDLRCVICGDVMSHLVHLVDGSLPFDI